jgi:hypothetical protein
MIQQLSGLNIDIVIATSKPAGPTITSAFFDAANITDGGMKLASKPVSTPEYGRMEYEYENDSKKIIAVTGEQNRVGFSQTLNSEDNEAPAIIRMSTNYTQMLPNLGCEAVGISFRGLKACPEDKDAASRFITSNFLAKSSFASIGKSPVRASINLVFDTERCPAYFNIAEASMRKEEEETTTPIVVFSGSFSYVLKGETSAEKLAYMHECIGNWQFDYAVFTDIVNNHFLAQNVVEPIYQELPQLEANNHLYAAGAV